MIKTISNLSLIVACDQSMRIGSSVNNSLLEHITSDLKYFVKKTKNNTVVMGYNTYESIGKILPERYNIIMSNKVRPNSNSLFTDNSKIGSFITVVKHAKDNPNKEIFIIGGSQIYELFLPYVSKMYITHIDHDYSHVKSEESVYFPHFDETEWELKSSYRLYDKHYLLFNTYERRILDEV